MALNTKLRKDDGSERQNREEIVALNAKLWRGDGSVRLNVNDDDPERRSWEGMMALNTQTEKMVALNAITKEG